MPAGKIRGAVEAEYRLQISPHVNERTLQPSILLVLRTTKAFASFRYELAVDERRDGKTIHLKILGLKAPQLDLPATGPAEFRREYEALTGNCAILIEGLDGSITTVPLRISKRAIKLRTPLVPGIVEVEISAPQH